MADPEEEEDDDPTVVIDRDVDDRTVVIDRDEDRTVVVDRPGRGTPAGRDSVINLLPARGRIPDARGPNAVETYAPRAVVPPPAAGPAVERGDSALRAGAASIPSVARNSRRAGAAALLAFALACVVSVIGVVAVIVWFVRS